MRMIQEGHAEPPWSGSLKRPVGNIFMPGRPDYPHHGERTPCQVILVSSPANVVVRQIRQMEEFYRMGRDLDAHFNDVTSSTHDGDRKWVVGAGCVAKVQGEGWARAQVVEEQEDG